MLVHHIVCLPWLEVAFMDIRVATPEDAAALLGIYEPYVRDTAITFEYEVPSLAEFSARIERTLQRYPFLVATDDDGSISGYTYAGPFKTRPAYDWTVETSIYIDRSRKRSGLGSALYNSLENVLHAQNVVKLVAFVARAGSEDDSRVDSTSYLFHRRMGYSALGEFRQCGYKFDRWYNVAIMQKQIASHSSSPAPFLPFPEVRGKVADLDIA